MRVMVADQDAVHRQHLVQQLQQCGHSTEEALTGRELIEHCRTKCPDLIILDAVLSGESGIDIINQVRQTGGHALWVPMVLMSADWTPEAVAKGIEAGVDDLLQKPVQDEKIKLRLNAAERFCQLKAEVFKVAHELVLENRSLQNVITRDALTGLNNSNHFEQTLEKEWKHSVDTHKNLSLVLLNCDFFQAYNQAYTAQVGDEALKKIADTLKQHLPSHSFLARTTGETFAVLLLAVDKEQAFLIGEQLRNAVYALAIPHMRSGCAEYLSVSFGVATLNNTHTYVSAKDFEDAADFALYQAKHNGKNRGAAAA